MVLPLRRGAVDVFYCPNRLGLFAYKLVLLFLRVDDLVLFGFFVK